MTLSARYSDMVELSRQMLVHAENQDWDRLAQTEAARLRMLDSMPPQLPSLPSKEYEAIANSIQEILAYDREILEYVTPWREQTELLLSRLSQTSG